MDTRRDRSSSPTSSSPSASARRQNRNTTESAPRLSTAQDPVTHQRIWGDIRDMRSRADAVQPLSNTSRVDYLVYAQMYEVNPNRQPHQSHPHSSGETPQASPPFGGMGQGWSPGGAADGLPGSHPGHRRASQYQRGASFSQHAGSRPRQASTASNLRPPNFTEEDQAYLKSRLPLRQPVTAHTVVNHFKRLPFLYQDLAEGCRTRASELPRDSREGGRRLRMAALAQRQADKYHAFRMILPRSYMDEIIGKWQGEQRTSRFWEKVLDEVEKSNSAWSIIRLWILLFVIQSSLVAVAYKVLPTPAQVVLLVANALAYIWSTTVMCEMLHSRYLDVKAEEQELHDLIGGLRA